MIASAGFLAAISQVGGLCHWYARAA